jgi:hypothetical protein
VVDAAPIQVIGSGATIDDATDDAFDRAGALLDTIDGEVRARCTFTGGVEIARPPGVVQLSMLAPTDRLAAVGLAEAVGDDSPPRIAGNSATAASDGQSSPSSARSPSTVTRTLDRGRPSGSTRCDSARG